MPLFPPITDTLRWDDLVRQGRAQLPLVAPDWTDQNTSDGGIAALELLSWLVESESYRASAITGRERRRLLALAGWTAQPAQAARCLVRVSGPSGVVVPAGLLGTGGRDGGVIPLTLTRAVAISGAEVVALAVALPGAEASGYVSDCADLTRARAAGRVLHPFGTDPRPDCSLMVGFQGGADGPGSGLGAGPLDLWLEVAGGTAGPEVPSTGLHHSVRVVWERWDGTGWAGLPDTAVFDDTAALTRSGGVHLELPTAVAASGLGDPTDGVLAGVVAAWLRVRLASGRHEAAPVLAAVHVDAGVAVAAQPYSTDLVLPPGTPVTGAPTVGAPGSLARAVPRPVIAPNGTVLAVGFDPLPTPGTSPTDGTAVPELDVVSWQPPAAGVAGRLQADFTVVGIARGVPAESFELPAPWCGTRPQIWVVEPDGTGAGAPVVEDPVLARADELCAFLDPDGITVWFGDGRNGRTLTAGATICASGTWTVPAGVGHLAPPLPVAVLVDARTSALLGPAAGAVALTPVASIATGTPAEGTTELAARAERTLWVHERLARVAARSGGSLDGLGLETIRRWQVPERAVTGPDFERITLATPGSLIARARALPEVDPRLPGLRAMGCVTVVVVCTLPLARPEPTEAVLALVRARLEATRTLGTRVFVVAPDYAVIRVTADLTLLDGATPATTLNAARAAVATFLHPVTGGPSGRGWPFGRTVRRSELLQLLDQVPGVNRVTALTLGREPDRGDCGDVPLCPTELALVGTIDLHLAAGARR